MLSRQHTKTYNDYYPSSLSREDSNRIGNPRVGRFFAVDPIASKYPNKSFYGNMVSSAWDDGRYWDSFMWSVKKKDDAVNHSAWEGGKLMLATAGAILSGGTLGTATTTGSIISSSAGLVISLDEFSRIREKETLLESIIRKHLGNTAADLFKGAKLAISVKDAAKGITNFTVKLAGGEMIHGTYDVIKQSLEIGNSSYNIADKMKNNSDNKKQDEK